MSRTDFHFKLAEELIDNNYDGVFIRERPRCDTVDMPEPLIGGIGTHVTPSSRESKQLMAL